MPCKYLRKGYCLVFFALSGCQPAPSASPPAPATLHAASASHVTAAKPKSQAGQVGTKNRSEPPAPETILSPIADPDTPEARLKKAEEEVAVLKATADNKDLMAANAQAQYTASASTDITGTDRTTQAQSLANILEEQAKAHKDLQEARKRRDVLRAATGRQDPASAPPGNP